MLLEMSPEIKTLIKSEEFSDIIKSKDLQYIDKWYKDFVQTSVPDTSAGKAVDWASRVLRRGRGCCFISWIKLCICC